MMVGGRKMKERKQQGKYGGSKNKRKIIRCSLSREGDPSPSTLKEQAERQRERK